MEVLKEKVVVFSGRFDPPHPGHIATIIRLKNTFKEVKVVMLNYPERRFPVTYCLKVLAECLQLDPSVRFFYNETHFGKLTLEEWEDFNADYYAGGNLSVLNHIEKMDIKTWYTERAFDYAASKYEGLDGNS